jgi:tetratricopeptide (TPR) repeat protein
MFWLGALIVFVALALGILGGYGLGMGERYRAQNTQVSQQLGDQFALAQRDFDNRQFAVARQRLEFILGEDAAYPGAAELLTKILVESAITPSPTVTPSPTLTPTPDIRAQEAIMADAQAKLASRDWDGAIRALDGLRKKDPGYKTAVVDSMYYTALRNRGYDKIIGMGAYAETTSLEGGLNDLNMAERFAPLDGVADGMRTWTRMYIQGASYWDVNWEQAVLVFYQVYVNAPNLRDGSNMTATERYRIALLRYGDQFFAQKKWCQAYEQYQASFTIAVDPNQELKKRVEEAYITCYPPTETPEPTATSFPTPPTP